MIRVSISWLLWVGRRGIVSRALIDLVVSATGRRGGYDKTSLTWEACYPYGAQQHDDKDTGGWNPMERDKAAGRQRIHAGFRWCRIRQGSKQALGFQRAGSRLVTGYGIRLINDLFGNMIGGRGLLRLKEIGRYYFNRAGTFARISSRAHTI